LRRAVDHRVVGVPCFDAFGTQAYPTLVVAIWVLLAIEVPAVHLILGSFLEPSPTRELLRWLMIGSSLDLGLWLIGDLRLMRERPVLCFQPDRMELRLGQRACADIPRDQLTTLRCISPSAPPPAAPSPARPLRITPLQAPNLRIELSERIEIRLLYGLKRSVQVFEVYVDDPAAAVDVFEGWRG